MSVSKKKSSYCDRYFRRHCRRFAVVVIVVGVVQNFNVTVAHYSKSIKDINIKLGILAHYGMVYLQDSGHNSESYILGVMPLFNVFFLTNDGPYICGGIKYKYLFHLFPNHLNFEYASYYNT